MILLINIAVSLSPSGAIFHVSEPVGKLLLPFCRKFNKLTSVTAPDETVLATGGVWNANDNLLPILTRVDDLNPNSPKSVDYNNTINPFSTTSTVLPCRVLQTTSYSIQFVISANFLP